MDPVFHQLKKYLESGEHVALATILHKEGSAPRGVGSKMIVRSDGSIEGTIGGGAVEASVIKTARECIHSGGAQVCDFDLSRNAAIDDMDLICGGNLSVLVERIEASQENTTLFRNAWQKHLNGEKAALVTLLPHNPRQTTLQSRRYLVAESGRNKSHTTFSNEQICFLLDKTRDMRAPSLCTIDEKTVLVEPCAGQGTVYLFGAGHVSQKVAELAAQVDFRTVVMDDRPEYANKIRFPMADQIHVLDDFGKALNNVHLNRDSYIVIVTRGHRHDKTVLAQALKSKAGYIGMIGSRLKVKTTFEALVDEGFCESDLKTVNSPIGLPIGAQTPMEIAVSIVAELIAARTRAIKEERAR